MRTTTKLRRAPAAAALLALGACSQIPPYQVPTAPTPPQWGETAPGWMAAAPADTLTRGPWWTLFGDAALNDLAAQVSVSNQTVAAAAAAVAQSEALVREQRASLLPTLSLDAGATRSGSGGADGVRANRFSLGLDGSWEPDLWGRLSAGVSAASAQAQASQADLANATLSAQAAFVSDYLTAREEDDEVALLQSTITAYQRALQITQNRYTAAIAQKSDVLQAQTTLAGAQADLASLIEQRAQLHHAMAVLLGRAPAGFALPPGEWKSTVVPAVPPGVPSDLLQRRPDIAASERAVAAANADIGAAQAAYFPQLTLSANGGQAAAQLGHLFDASATTWSFGLAIAQVLFDGGALRAASDAAKAAWQQQVANYRQTVLTAFQSVEDQLSAAGSLEQQQALRKIASEAADQTEQEMLNRYQQGLNAYTDVVTAQATALSARRTLLQVSVGRQTAAVSLIEALGGGWSTDQLTAAAN